MPDSDEGGVPDEHPQEGIKLPAIVSLAAPGDGTGCILRDNRLVILPPDEKHDLRKKRQ